MMLVFFSCDKHSNNPITTKKNQPPLDYMRLLVLPTCDSMNLKGPVFRVRVRRSHNPRRHGKSLPRVITYTFNQDGMLIALDKPLRIKNVMHKNEYTYNYSFDSSGRVDSLFILKVKDNKKYMFNKRIHFTYDSDSADVIKTTIDESGNPLLEQRYSFLPKLKVHILDTDFSVNDSLKRASSAGGSIIPKRERIVNSYHTFDTLGRCMEIISDYAQLFRYRNYSKNVYTYNDSDNISKRITQEFSLSRDDTLWKTPWDLTYTYSYDKYGNWLEKHIPMGSVIYREIEYYE